MGELDGRVAFITGASEGIGAACARAVIAGGGSAALISRRGTDLGLDRAIGIACDVRDGVGLERAAERAAQELGGIDILVANAGVASYGPFDDLTLDEIDEMIDVNAKGTIYAVRAALPYLRASSAADIVTLASEAGRRGFPNETVYCASKFAQVGFTRALDGELREAGIRCTNVCPGGVDTGFAMGRGRSPGDTDGMISPDDIAELVTFIVTRPRGMRVLETALRPMIEASWG